MISLDDFSQLLAVLYSTPLHPERWELFLSLLCKHTNSRSGFLICADSRAHLSMRAQGGVPVALEIMEVYAAKYAQRDPFLLPLLKSGRIGAIDCEQLLPREALLQSDMYRHLHEPMGYRYPGLVALTCTLRRLEAISFWRTEDEGHLDADAMHLLSLLVPHLQSAMEIRQALGIAEVQIGGLQTMLDASSTASFLLGPDGEILHANAAARALLNEADGLLEGNGRIQAARPTMKKPLHQLVMGGSSKHALVGASPATRSLALERTSAACPLRLLASPVPNYGPSVPGLEAAEGTLLLVTDPEKPIVLRDDVLRAHYGFTSAETEVANGLLTGFSVDEIAALRRVVPGTVRYQIKSIMAKAGTSRQTDLVRLLMSLPRHP